MVFFGCCGCGGDEMDWISLQAWSTSCLGKLGKFNVRNKTNSYRGKERRKWEILMLPCMCFLAFISPLGVIDHCTVLLLLIVVLKGCGDSMFVVHVPPIFEDARKVFDNILEWNVVLWSNMIVGYALNGKDEEAIVSYFGRGGLDTNTIRNETHDK